MALGGSETASAQGPLDALTGNPAALSSLRSPTLDAGFASGFVRGEFENRANDDVSFRDQGTVPLGAFGLPLGKLTLGLGVIPDATIRSDWRYLDTPGGADGVTSYGVRTHKSEILLLRTALGASWQITERFAIGASAGLLYNRNRLEGPYIIQTDAALRSVKTLLDLETEGWGWNGQFGLLWRPTDTLQIGLSYTLESRIAGEGRAFSDASAQLRSLGAGALNPDGTFAAEVTNVFPQKISAGLAWRATPRLQLIAQIDWIDWSSAFDTLEVRLRDVDSPVYRSLLGRSNLDDDVPLNWRDQWVWRFGAEYALNEHWTVRAGYSYARSPVPGSTLTPLTAAIMEHTIGAGVGWKAGQYGVDVAWQWAIPNEQRVRESDLLSGEYANSRVEVGAHWLGFTTSVEF